MFKWFYREEGDVGRSESGHDRVWFHQFQRVLVVRAAYEATLRARKLPMNLPSSAALYSGVFPSAFTPPTHTDRHTRTRIPPTKDAFVIQDFELN